MDAFIRVSFQCPMTVAPYSVHSVLPASAASDSLCLCVCRLILINTVTKEQRIIQTINPEHRPPVDFGARRCLN